MADDNENGELADCAYCKDCDMPTQCPYFKAAAKHNLTESVRHLADPVYSKFLSEVRTTRPTQEQIDNVLGPAAGMDRSCFISEEDIYERASKDTTILCSHLKDVHVYNKAILKASFATASIQELPIKHHEVLRQADKQNPAFQHIPYPAEIETWINHPAFHTLPQAAIGAKVICTHNLNMAGIVNGTLGTIVDLIYNNKGQLFKVVVLQENGSTVPYLQSVQKNKCLEGREFTKCAFPLMLAYAMTGHKVRNMAIDAQAFYKALCHMTLSNTNSCIL